MKHNSNVDLYLAEGCGRCSLGGTPDCKVHNWTKELVTLREIIQECGLDEERKWGVPCYTLNGKNVVMLSALKNFCTISFMKGMLLTDKYNLLQKPGENSRIGRILKFTSIGDIITQREFIKDYIFQAIEIEKSGAKVELNTKDDLVYPEELEVRFNDNPELKKSFEKLSPGKQRGYIIHFSSPKQSKTRYSRIDKQIEKIIQGKGFFD